MKLYHYTATHHLNGVGPHKGHAGPGILRSGIKAKIHPYIDAPGLVWLTTSDDWSQTWSTRDVEVPGFGPCNRTEVRVEVVIPKTARWNLYPWSKVRERVLTTGLARDLERYGDSENWFVFNGNIPAAWVRTVETRP